MTVFVGKGVPEKYVSVLKEFYRHTSSRVRVYGQLSPLFVVSSKVRHGLPIFSFLLNFVGEGVLCDVLSCLLDGGVELLLGNIDMA